MKPLSLEARLFIVLLLAVAFGALTAALLMQLLDEPWQVLAAALALGALPALWLARSGIAPLQRLLRALGGAVASYRDGDFSLSLVVDRSDELGELVRAHNALGAALREQRQHLVQRELLLDTVMQNSPVALVLVDTHSRVVYANLSARHLLNEGVSLAGLDFEVVLARVPAPLREAVQRGEDALIPVELDDGEEMVHLSRRGFLLQARPHRLYLLRLLTREISRQEVASWKKLIRVISHELNNSLAPISSMAHTGAELVRRGQPQRLPEVFAGISERARHLHGFIEDYASFARLPAPRPDTVDWGALLSALALQWTFRHVGALPTRAGWFDRAQIEQVLINLLKNAHESGSAAADIELQLSDAGREVLVEVRDRGSGMSEAVLANALLPFYSTKHTGTGLGLALAREIVEAHGGRISLSNREGGGLAVQLRLPATAPVQH